MLAMLAVGVAFLLQGSVCIGACSGSVFGLGSVNERRPGDLNEQFLISVCAASCLKA
jgi:hypothetical protein